MNIQPQGWWSHWESLRWIAERQLFFIGGAPSSGTTWVQRLLASHSDICCRGEGFFLNQLAIPAERLVRERSDYIANKNSGFPRKEDGYPLPTSADADFIIGAGILSAFARQCGGHRYSAIGEKTPENVFLFGRLHRIFPDAKFLAVVRDPRDVLVSAWLRFHLPDAPAGTNLPGQEFVRSVLPSLQRGLVAMFSFSEECPTSLLFITYENLRREPIAQLARVLRFLGVSDSPALVERCVSNAALIEIKSTNQSREGSGAFAKKPGEVGRWQTWLSPELSQIVANELGWSFARFGYEQNI